MAFSTQFLKSTWQIVAGVRHGDLIAGSPPVCLQTLEDRVLYDASPLAAYAADLNESIETLNEFDDSLFETANFELFADSKPSAIIDNSNDYLIGQPNDEFEFQDLRQLIVIDGQVDDFESLMADVYANGQSSTRYEVVRLDQLSSGIDQITELLDGRIQYNAVHVVSHGSDGRLQLGNTEISLDNLGDYESQLSSWTRGLARGADILLYGCNVAETGIGESFVEQFSELVGADVAASDDLTGNAALAGDWDFEYFVGDVTTELAFSIDIQADWMGLLAPGNIGTAIWGESGSNTPETSQWDGASFGTEANAANVGQWRVMQGAEAPTRDEAIVVGVDTGGTIEGQIWDGSSWTTLGINPLGTVTQTYWWGMDVAYESTSGDAILVWADGANIEYASWDGVSWSSVNTIGIYSGATPRQLQLAASPDSDEMVLVVSDSSSHDRAYVWDGDGWGNAVTLATNSGDDRTDINVAYEQQSGHAMVVYSDNSANDLRYQMWDGVSWSGQTTLTDPSALGAARWTTIASDPNSDRIAVGVVTFSNEAWFAVWDGSTWGSKVLAEPTTHGSTFPNAAVAFESNSGDLLATYAEGTKDDLRYRTWSSGGGWSAEQKTPDKFGDALNSMTLASDPFSNDIMLALQDDGSDLNYVLWDGSSWGTPSEHETNTGETKNQPFLFLWDQTSPLNTAPTDLQPTATTEGGLNINNDGGNDTYFVADDGGGLLGGLTTVTIETSFSVSTPGADLTPLLSYADGTNDEELSLFLKSDGRIWFAASTNGAAIQSTVGNYTQLFDGEIHHVAVSWDSATGTVEFYVDGASVESFTGYQTGQSVGSTGELVIGQDQDSVLGGFNTIDVFKGTLYDVRIFDDIRTAGEISANFDTTLPNTEPGMIANWTFNDLSTGGVITDSVSGNNLTEQHISAGGFSSSDPELSLTVSEDAPDTTVIGVISAIDSDVADTFTYSLTDNAGGRFAISAAGEISVANASLIDFESAVSHNITVEVIDSASNTYSEVFTIGVIDANDAAVESSIEGSNVSYTENDGTVQITNTIAIADLDDTNIESAIVEITGNYTNGQDVLAFTNTGTITGLWDAVTGTVTLTGSDTLANYELALQSITYENTSDDPSGLTRTVSFTVNDGDVDSNTLTRDIDVTPVNDASVESTIEGANVAYSENDGVVQITNTIAIADLDDTNIESAVVQITGNYANGQDSLAFTNTGTITGVWNSVSGTMTLTGSDTLANYELALQSITYENTSDDPSGLTRTVSFTVNDGDVDSNTLTRDIDVTPVNDASVESTIEGSNLAYTENDGAVQVTNTIAVADLDDTNIESAVVQITGNYANGQDILAFTNTGTITGVWDAVTGTVTLTGSDTLANYELALQSITYENTSDDPSGLTRTVSFTVNDGDVDSNTLTRDIDVTPVNDASVESTIEGSNLAYTENDGAVQVTNTIAVADLDDTNIESAVVQITGNYANGQDILAFTNTGTITGVWDAVTGTVTLTGSDTLANYELALQSITYENTSDDPSGLTRTVSFTVNDGDVDSNALTRDIDVTPVNDASVESTIEGANVAYTENDGATQITNAISIADLDDTNIESAVIQITGNYATGQDVLAFINTGTITGVWNAVAGTMTLTGTDTLANYELALQSTTYENTSDDPSGLTRTVSFTVHDGDDNSNTLTRDIDVLPSNDAPVESAIEGTNVSYNENDPATQITNTIAIADLDDTNVESAVIQITGNYANGQDVLAFTNTGTITGVWNAVAGTMTLTGSDTLANYELALQSITYENTSDDPSGLTRTVSFTVNDGDVDSNTLTRDIDITPVNDASVESTIEGTNLAYSENDGVVQITNTIAIADLDDTNIESAAVEITGNYVNGQDVLAFTNTGTITGVWDAVAGTMTLTGSDTLANYELALQSITYENTSDDPSNLTRTVSFTVNDGDVDSNTLTRDIDVTPVNDASVESAIEGTNVAYSENDGAVQITNTIAIADLDDTNIESAVVAITGNYTTGQDVLAFTNTGTITGVWDAVAGTMTLTGSDTLANYELALQSITYENTSEDPSGLMRTVSFTVNDGDVDSNTLTRNIDVTPVNDASVESAIEGTNLAYTENDGAVQITNTIAIADLDDTNIESAVVEITGNYTNGQDSLAFTNTGTITGVWDAVAGTMTLTGSDTLANYELALQSITYENTSEDPSGLMRTVSFTVNDGDVDSNTLTRNIDVTPVNDASVESAIEGTNLAYTENDGAVQITNTIAIADLDDTNIESAVVEITGNYTNGQDSLAFTNTGTITGVWDAVAGTMTLTGSDTLANFEAALRSVTYENTSDDPSGLTRTVSFTVNDGDVDSNALTRDIDVTPVNDASVESTIEGATVAYTENDGATQITNAISIADLDDTNIESAVIQITGNYATGQDVLAFINTGTITGVWNAVAGTMTLTGTDTLANYELALQSTTYENTSDDPSGLTRTVSFTVHDGDDNSNTLTRDIDVLPSNDAPVESAIEGTNVSYNENDPATQITNTIAIADLDDTNVESAVIQITGNYANGQDVLAFTNTGTITGVWNAVAGTMTLTGSDTLANYELALQSITYENTSDDPSGLTRTVSFTVNDGDVDSNTLTRDIDITPVNDASVESTIEGTNLAYSENDGEVQITNTIAIADLDDTNIESAAVEITGNYVNGQDVLAFTNTGTITGVWDAVAGTMTLTGSDTLANYELALQSITYENTSDDPSNLTRTVSFTVNDGDVDSNTLTRDIDVTPVNDASVESAIEGTNVAYSENDGAVQITNTIAIADLDDTNIESAVVAITGNYTTGQDILAFTNTGTITGVWDGVAGTMTLTGSDTLANYELALQSITYENTSDDPSGLTRTVSFTVNDGDADSNTLTRNIDVAPVNDASVESAIEGSNVAYSENDGTVQITNTISIADLDDTNIESAVIQITGNYATGQDVLAFINTGTITGVWNAVAGTMTLTGSDALANYELALQSITYENTSDDPSGLTRTVSFTVHDGDDNSNTLTRDIDVLPSNDAPVESAIEGTNVSYNENDPATQITNTIAIADLDDTNVESAVIQITGNYANGQDVLAFTNTGTITGVWSAVAGTMTLTGSDTLANYELALQSITYENTSEDPSGLMRTVSFTVNDGDVDSNTLTRNIDVTPVNDASVESAIEGTNLAYTENDGAVQITNTIAIADLDDTNIESAVVQITGNYANGQDVLAFVDIGPITGVWNAALGTLTLTGSDSLANYEAALRTITYQNTSDDPAGLTRTVSFTVNDGAVDSNTLTRNIDVTPVNDAPVESAIEVANLSYTENDLATQITNTISIADFDDTNIESALVEITGNFVTGEDVLAFVDIGPITGVWDPGAGTMTLTGTDTLANYEAALRTITYQNTSSDPSGLTRTVSFTVNDGDVDSNTLTRNIDVTPVNDTPVESTIEATNIAYTENDPAVQITNTISIADLDDTNIESAVVEITGNFVTGEDVLAFVDLGPITGVWNATLGTLTLTGSDTLANYETALRTITYQNTSDDPSGLARTVSFTVNDGDSDSNALTRDIDITSVNDAPVESTIEGTNVAYTENDPATPITNTIAIADFDDTSIESAVIQITGNYTSGQDVLAFVDTGTITGIWDSLTGTLTLTGSDTLANYETALRAVTYENTSDNPSALTRTVSFSVNDGDVDSNTLTRGLDVTPVNEAPTDINPNSFAIDENIDTSSGTSVGSLTAIDEDTGETFAYSIVGGLDGANFVIGGGGMDELVFNDGVLDFETQSTYSVIVRVTDSAGNTYDENLTVNVNDLNETPTDIAPNSFAIDENTDTSGGTSVGTLTTTDEDAGESFTYFVVGGTDAANFMTVGDQLMLTDGVLDFEANSTYDVIVRVTDSGGLSYDENLTINVNDLNEAPTDIAPNSIAVNENIDTTGGVSVGTLTATDEDAGETFSYSIAGGADAASFTTVGDQLMLNDGVLDFETQSTYDVIVRVTDSGGLTYDENLTINLNDLNEAPTDIAPNSIAINENIDTTGGFNVGTLNSTDEDAGESFTYAIVGGADAANFATVGDQLMLNDGVLDFESKSTYDVIVRVTDSGGLSYDENLTINVNDLNEAPTDIAPNSLAVNENIDTTGGVSVGTLTATDVDAGETFTYAIVGGADAANFTTVGDQLMLNDGLLDFETKSTYDVIVRVTDAGGLTYDENLTISLNDLNEAPTDILPDSLAINENIDTTGGLSVGTLTATDEDAVEAFTYSIVGGADAVKFLIGGGSGDQLILNDGVLDFETKSTYDVIIRVTDAGGLSYDETLAVNVNDLNENPVINDQLFVINENTPNGISFGFALSTELDAGDSVTYAVVGGTGSTAFAVNPFTGEITVADDSQLDFETAPVFTLTVEVTDTGGLKDTATITINLADINDEQVLATNMPLNVNEGAAGVIDDSLLETTDQDHGPTSLVYSVTTPPSNGTLLVSGSPLLTFTQDDIDNGRVTYLHNGSETTIDTFDFTVDDGVGAASLGTFVITINPINDAPVANDDGIVLNEGATHVGPSSDALGNDVDAEFDPLTASLVSGPIHGTLVLNADGSFTYTHDGSETSSDSFQYRVNDGAVNSNVATVNITVVPVNDAPVGVGDNHTVGVGAVLNDLVGVLANDSDVDSSPITAILVASPANGTISLNPDGSFTYTPDLGFVGSDSFTYLPNDGSVTGNLTTVNINVTGLLPPPIDPIVPPGPTVDPPIDPIDSSDPPDDPTDDPTDDSESPVADLTASSIPEPGLPFIGGDFTSFASGDFRGYIDLLTDRKLAEEVLRMLVENTSPEMLLDADDIRRLRLSSGLGVAFDANFLWKQLDDLIRPDSMFDNLTVTVGAITTIGTMGYVLWSLRGGALVALALAQLPSWRMIDPLPVLETYSMRKGKKDEGVFGDFF